MRALERRDDLSCRRSVAPPEGHLRAALLVVDPHGRVVAQADDAGGDVVLVTDLPVAASAGKTLYGRVGNWPAALAAATLGVLALRAIRAPRAS